MRDMLELIEALKYENKEEESYIAEIKTIG
jgi:hypothetical protein